jgi:hypothetical protein
MHTVKLVASESDEPITTHVFTLFQHHKRAAHSNEEDGKRGQDLNTLFEPGWLDEDMIHNQGIADSC